MVGKAVRGIGLCLALVVTTAAPALAAGASTTLPHLATYGFDRPDAVAVSSGDLFVSNRAGNSVTVVSAASGSHIATLKASGYHFDVPTAVVVADHEVFVADSGSNSISVLSTSNRLPVRTISLHAGADGAWLGLATDGTAVYALSRRGDVTKIDASTGALAGVAHGRTFGFERPTAIAVDGGRVFVANWGGDSVTVIRASDMSFVADVDAARFGFDQPNGMTVSGSDVWISNAGNDTLTEMTDTDRVAQVVPNTEGYLPDPGPMAAGDDHVYVASPPGSSPMITQATLDRPAALPWMMCNTNGPYQFNNPEAMVVVGKDLWVVNEGGTAGAPGGDSLTEMKATSGAPIKVVS